MSVSFSPPRSLYWLVPVLLSLLIYGPAIGPAEWIVDDHVNLQKHAAAGNVAGEWLNPTYLFAGGLPDGHVWRPLPSTLHHLMAIFIGRDPPLFRSLNLLVHLLNIFLLFRLAKATGSSDKAATWVTTLWALHPILAEAVSWSSDINDLMLGSFILLYGLVLVSKKLTWVSLFASFTLLFMACLCKEVGLAFVPVVFVISYFLQEGKNRFYQPTTAVFAGSVYYFLHQNITTNSYSQSIASVPLIQQLQAWSTNWAWALYLPHQAPFSHIFDPNDWVPSCIGGIFILFLGSTIAVIWKLHRQPAIWLLIASLSWLILLLPVGVGVPISGLHGFRYSYLPAALFFGFLAVPLTSLLKQKSNLVIPVLLIYILLNGIRTIQRVPAYQNDGTLFHAELQIEPNNPYALVSLGKYRVKQGDYQSGLALWSQGVEMMPLGYRLADRPSERYQLAQALFLVKAPQQSLFHIQKTIQEWSSQKRVVPRNAWCLLADSLDRLGKNTEAKQYDSRCRPALQK